MKHQLKTIRAALQQAKENTTHGQIAWNCKEALTALSELERMAGEQEPVAVRWCREGYHWTYEDYKLGMFYGRWVKAERPYTAAPPAQQTVTNDEQATAYMNARLWEFIDMAGMWPKAKPDPRIWAHVMVYAPPAQQPQAEKRCQYCDGTGDVHSIDGQWRGECHCQKQPQAEAVHNKPVRVCHIKDVACSEAAVKCGECPDAAPPQAEAVTPGCVVDRGFRWDGEKQQHIPQLVIEFDPVPANSPCDAQGWKDRDAVAKMFSPKGEKP